MSRDANLSFNEHCDNICMRVEQHTGLLCHVQDFLPRKLALQLYDSHTSPLPVYFSAKTTHFVLYCRHLPDIQQNCYIAKLMLSGYMLRGQKRVETFKCLQKLDLRSVNMLISHCVPEHMMTGRISPHMLSGDSDKVFRDEFPT